MLTLNKWMLAGKNVEETYDAIAKYFTDKWDTSLKVSQEILLNKRKLERVLFNLHISFICHYLDKNALRKILINRFSGYAVSGRKMLGTNLSVLSTFDCTLKKSKANKK